MATGSTKNMLKAAIPSNEEERLELLEKLNILYTENEELYDDLAYLASVICETPIALISLVAKDVQWFKARIGTEEEKTGRDEAFCSHAILSNSILYVPDAKNDPRFSDNPLVDEPHSFRFYAGYPLDLGNELRLGTLCVVDYKPRELNEKQLKCLEMLGKQAAALLRLRLAVAQTAAAQDKDRNLIKMLNHELRNSLTALRGFLNLFEESSPEEIKKMTVSCNLCAERMLKVVDDFLLFDELDAKAFKLQKSSSDLNRCIQKSIDLMKGLLTQKEIDVELALDETIPQFFFDFERISQVVGNFISNACKYAAEGRRLLISSKQESQMARVEIQDFGPGISEELLPRLFNAFAKDTKSKISSSGLGLYIAKEIVKLHGGEVGVDSKQGQGTTFFFTLPLESNA